MQDNKDTNAVYVKENEKWEFNEKVADCFEDMLERSIPQYDVMRQTTVDLAYNVLNDSKGIKTSPIILDIGCSDGLMIKKMNEKIPNGRFLGIDTSEAMINKAKERFASNDNINIEYCDLRDNFPNQYFDVVTSCLTLQFTPIEHRQHIIQNIYDSLSFGNGCFLMIEKVLGNTDKINKLLVKSYYDVKRNNGYTQEQIDRKRLSLEGVLVPVTNDWNIDLLKQAGFRHVDVYWRYMNFVGYIAIK